MIAHAKSKYQIVENLSDIPILGGFIIALFSAIPGMFLTIYSSWINEISEIDFQIYTGFSFVLWNLFLWKKEIKLYIFFIPAWLLWLIIGVLKYLNIIN